jgi:hypothetical protein
VPGTVTFINPEQTMYYMAAPENSRKVGVAYLVSLFMSLCVRATHCCVAALAALHAVLHSQRAPWHTFSGCRSQTVGCTGYPRLAAGHAAGRWLLLRV